MSHKHCKVNDRVPRCTTCCNIFQASKKYATRQWLATLRFVPDHFKTPDMCSKAVRMNPWPLKYVPDHLKTQDMCDEVVAHNLSNLRFVRCAMMLRSWIEAWFLLLTMRYYFVCLRCYSLLFLNTLKLKRCVEKPLKKVYGHWILSLIVFWRRRCLILQYMWSHPWSLRIIPDHFKSQEMCDEAVAHRPYTLQNVLDWFLENNG